MNPIFIQAIAYFFVLVFGFGLTALFMKGFFWPYIRVRMSLGSKVLVKIREINRDLYSVGIIEENTLIYKRKGVTKRITNLPKDEPIFYKTIGVNMLDVDAERNAVCTVNYRAVEGFDAVKQEQLLIRALEKPQITDNKEKIVFALLIGIALGVAAIAFMTYKTADEVAIIKGVVEGLNRGLITAGG